MRAKRLILLAASISLVALWGCSSSMDSAGGKSEVDESYENVGFDVCISCHDLTGLIWLASRHGNSNYSPSSQNVPGESSCAVCHNPLDDAALIPETYGTNIARRDIVACESCHGGGSRHYGLGPIPYPMPTPDICGACHNRDDRHRSENSIYDKWMDSNHAKSPRSGTVCQRCHSHEGAIAANSYGYTGNKDLLGTNSDPGSNAPPAIPAEDLSSVQCATCHDVHNAGKLRTVYADRSEEPWDPNLNGSNSDQFDVCTSCHNLFDNDGTTIIASGSAVSDTAPYYHDTTWYRIIASTHYDQPTDTDGCDSSASSIIEGYNVRKDSENPCFDCHGHEAFTNTRPRPEGDDRGAPTIWTEWSSSAHAGHLFQIKLEAASEQAGGGDPADAPNNTTTVDAVMFAGITGETGEAWTFYNWDHPGRAACQRCHTTTGAMNFMDATANDEEYNPDNNDFSHLSGWVAGEDCGSPQNEVLYCWGCHSDARDGILRNPGPITEEYDPAVIVEYPDINDSNVCMTCHLGREAGEVIKTKTGFDDLSFVNPHYLAAGGTVFAATGYTFSNRDYSIPASDTHVYIGWGETGNPVVDSYTTGPCVTCHFDSNDGPHTLSPFTQYEIDDLALNPVCVNCHTSRGEGSDAANAWLGTDFTLDDLVAGVVGPHKGRYLAALEALNVQLAENGFTFTPNFPNFSNTNWLSPGDTDATGNTTGKNNMGGAFNYNLLIYDPGGVAHNRRYTRRLIYDAIDWLDDNVLNYSVAATLNALSDTTDYKASAISYLLQAENGDAGDRY